VLQPKLIHLYLTFSPVPDPLLMFVRKNAAHKESSGEKSHIQEPSLMAGPNRQAGQGKDGAVLTLGGAWLL
jgi:hypothetical protein